jgi:GDPmannose 4,6-dehydratase
MTHQKKALITGIPGQDESYFAELLFPKGYEVHGLIFRAATFNTSPIDDIYVDTHEPGVQLLYHYGDLLDSDQIANTIYDAKPEEFAHLGTRSYVRVCFEVPGYTGKQP